MKSDDYLFLRAIVKVRCRWRGPLDFKVAVLESFALKLNHLCALSHFDDARFVLAGDPIFVGCNAILILRGIIVGENGDSAIERERGEASERVGLPTAEDFEKYLVWRSHCEKDGT